MNFFDVKTTLREYRMTITQKGKEYRVNFQYGQEVTAYYTSDLQDAKDTGISMRQTGMIFEDA